MFINIFLYMIVGLLFVRFEPYFGTRFMGSSIAEDVPIIGFFAWPLLLPVIFGVFVFETFDEFLRKWVLP